MKMPALTMFVHFAELFEVGGAHRSQDLFCLGFKSIAVLFHFLAPLAIHVAPFLLALNVFGALLVA